MFELFLKVKSQKFNLNLEIEHELKDGGTKVVLVAPVPTALGKLE